MKQLKGLYKHKYVYSVFLNRYIRYSSVYKCIIMTDSESLSRIKVKKTLINIKYKLVR